MSWPRSCESARDDITVRACLPVFIESPCGAYLLTGGHHPCIHDLIVLQDACEIPSRLEGGHGRVEFDGFLAIERRGAAHPRVREAASTRAAVEYARGRCMRRREDRGRRQRTRRTASARRARRRARVYIGRMNASGCTARPAQTLMRLGSAVRTNRGRHGVRCQRTGAAGSSHVRRVERGRARIDQSRRACVANIGGQ
jgi:hypothetical protein